VTAPKHLSVIVIYQQRLSLAVDCSSSISWNWIVRHIFWHSNGATTLSMLPCLYLLSPCPVHTGDKAEFCWKSTVSLWPGTHDRIGNKVNWVGDNVDRDKLSNSSCFCCWFVAKTGNKVDRISYSRRCCRFVAGFGNNRLCRECVPGLRHLGGILAATPQTVHDQNFGAESDLLWS